MRPFKLESVSIKFSSENIQSVLRRKCEISYGNDVELYLYSKADLQMAAHIESN